MDEKLLQKYLVRGETDWSGPADRSAGLMRYQREREDAFEALMQKKFIPNSPCLINAKRGGSLMACYLIRVGNSRQLILEAVALCAEIFSSGGGVGIDIDDLVPQGTPLSRSGVASGPVSFLGLFDVLGGIIMEGGLRRAAEAVTMSALNVEAIKFARAKEVDGRLKNMNLSLTYPAGPDSALRTFREHVKYAALRGEPGGVFLDRINAVNPLAHIPEYYIRSVNACAELPLTENEPCAIASVVLPNVVEKLGDYAELIRITRMVTRFLDQLINATTFPARQFGEKARMLRRIAAGLMGWDTLLKREGIPFVSRDALILADEIGRAWSTAADDESRLLAQEFKPYSPGHGITPEFRNVARTAIAPTGHTSRLAGVSASIYPGSYAEHLGMTPSQHIDNILAWQKWVDSSVSYTICFRDKTVAEVEGMFREAWERGVKVLSVYPDGSREGQPCNLEGCAI